MEAGGCLQDWCLLTCLCVILRKRLAWYTVAQSPFSTDLSRAGGMWTKWKQGTLHSSPGFDMGVCAAL